MNAKDQATVDALTDFMAAQLPVWYGAGARLDLAQLSLERFPYSFFLSIPVLYGAETRTLLIKIKRQPDVHTLVDAIAIERLKVPAMEEFAMLEKIWTAFSDGSVAGCAAVRSVAYLEAWNALVMEKFEGRALKSFFLDTEILFRSRREEVQLKEFVAASARWLRVFHQRVSEMERIPFPTDVVWQDILESLERLEKYSGAYVDVSFYRSAFEKALAKVAHLQVPFGLVHDDYHYSNILVDDAGQICVIDHAGNYRTCAYVDLATLITDPQTRTRQIMTNGFYISRRFIDELRAIILQNYFLEDAYSSGVIDFFCAMAVLNKWSEGLARFSLQRGRSSVFFLKWVEKYFSKRLMKYLSYVS